MAELKINMPTLKRDDYDGGKFVAVIVVAVAAVVAGYRGWVILPPLETIGGLLGLLMAVAVIVAVVFAVNTENKTARNVAVIVAVIAGFVAGQVWRGLVDFVTGLSWPELAGLLIGLVVTLVVAAWCARK